MIFNIFKKRDRSFVTELDQMLFQFDQAHPKSLAQQAEIDKANSVSDKRDNPNYSPPFKSVWENF